MDKYVGKRLDGRYEITELLGSGGMANVYKANDILEGNTVAVKILKDEFSQNSEFLRRFKNESKAIALLSHPNIVRVIDVSFGDRIQYIVMEYISGITLKEYIEQQSVLKWKEVVHFTVQILRALQHAHDNGIVHRDIKPQNIMLLQDGTIKVMDFGIARFARGDSKTITDKAIGSVHYISPEQARGDKIDEKADIYSVGVMMFEMLTGQLPFVADSAVSVAIMQMQAPVKRPREINATIPEGLEEIIIRAMQKDPAQRYQSAAEMLRDIDEFKKNPSILFEYKYFGDENATKYFDAIEGKPENHEEENTEKEKKSHLIPILAGIAGAFVVVSIIVCVIIFGFSDIFNKVPDVEVPNLVGQVYDDAVKQYPDIKIEQRSQELSDKYDAGYIISQEIDAGMTMKENATLYVVVSKGFNMVDVPDVTNKPSEEAVDTLEKKGFTVSQVKQFDSTVAKGNVIRTDPAAGKQVKAKSEIIVYVSMGTEDKPIIMPKVIGSDYNTAKATLEGLKLKVASNPVNDSSPAGTVLTQSIADGQQVTEGTLVTLEVSNGTPKKNKLDFAVKIPATAADKYQNFTFTLVSEDNTLIDTTTKVVGNLLNQTVTLFSYEGTGSHNFTIMVVPQNAPANTPSMPFVTYSADFDNSVVSITSQNDNVFTSFS